MSALQRLCPLSVSVVAACDRRIWPASLESCTRAWIPEACDAGVVQSDDVTVDLESTGRRLDDWMDRLEAITAREAARLSGAFDLVLGDVPSPAFEAAHRSGIPSVAVANFSWDWIYSELGFAGASEASAEAYARTTLLLEAAPFGPMPAFPRRCTVGLIARSPSSRRDEARSALGVSPRQTLVVLAFQPASAPPMAWPPVREGRVFAVPAGFPVDRHRVDVRVLPGAVTFPDALAAADVVLGKPGYGLVGDVDAAGVRFLYVPRPGFPENAVLEEHLLRRAGTASLASGELAAGQWEDRLVDLEQRDRPARADAGGADRSARAIGELLEISENELE